ncbi:MAG: Gfo/Idh/MocA family oxidoreductase [Phycisphaerae bacterium]|nr:Gfo/Idh/MocA family oxidoreductase [Phycisphaerae bacterium]
MAQKDGQNYAPRAANAQPVCQKGDFRFSVVGLTHGHIYGMTQNLLDAGGEVVGVFDPDPAKVEKFRQAFPAVQSADCEERILDDAGIQMIATADIPAFRGPLGLRVLGAGKHFFTDKAPFTTLKQLAEARRKVEQTGLLWAVCYTERLQSEAAGYAEQLIASGAIGRVVQVIGLGPHRVNAPTREPYFFKIEEYGGILCDVGSHQVEQFLFFAGCKDAEVVHSKVANFHHPDHPGLEDFGDANLLGDNGASNYFRVDWLTPEGLSTWGDGRTFILGTEGYIELRKYVDVAREATADHVYWVDAEGEHYFNAAGQVGFPYFGRLILDVLSGTRNAMPQEHAFKAAELALQAQAHAIRVK